MSYTHGRHGDNKPVSPLCRHVYQLGERNEKVVMIAELSLKIEQAYKPPAMAVGSVTSRANSFSSVLFLSSQTVALGAIKAGPHAIASLGLSSHDQSLAGFTQKRDTHRDRGQA